MIARRFSRSVALSLCAAAIAWLGCGGAAGETFAQAAARAVTAMGEEGSRTILAPGRSGGERGDRLGVVLSQRFDVPAIARQSLGYHWSAATAEQRREFTELFTSRLMDSYVALLHAEPTLSFTVTGQRDEGPREALVLSQRGQRTDAAFLRIDWRMRLGTDGQPRVIDIIVNGVSMVRKGQDDFDSSIRTSGQGMEGLLELLRAKYALSTVVSQ